MAKYELHYEVMDEDSKKKGNGYEEAFEWIETLLASFFVVILVFTFILRIAEVSGESMLPTLIDKDRLVVSYLGYTPKNGDIVLVDCNATVLEEVIVKRVIATEGQTVDIDFESGKVKVDGKIHAKGAYVKDLNDLDYDLPIVNEAIRNYMIFGTPVEVTINSCTDFRKFQKIVKLSNKYRWVEHEHGHGTIKFDNKAYRVFASNDNRDGRLLKCDGVRNPAKFGNTPDKCFIFNDDIKDVVIPKKLDRQWYIDLARKRLEDFGV